MEVELLHYGYLVVILGVILEGDATLLTASFLARRGYFSFVIVMALAAMATTVANQVYFEFARHGGPGILKTFPAAAARMEKVYGWLPRYGGPVVIASRFLLGFRTLVPMVCGSSGMNRWRFLLWNIAGAAIWAGGLGGLGYLGAHAFSVLLADIRRYEFGLAVGIAIAALAATRWVTRGGDWRDLRGLRRALLGKQK
jgi:membrane protein DedA with SNARE-associated domain